METPVLGLKRAISENSELTIILEFVLFQTYQKFRINDVKVELQKLQKKLVPTRKLTRMFGLKFGMQGFTREDRFRPTNIGKNEDF